MFKSKAWRVHPGTTDTLIGEGTVFRGTLTSAADIRIEGQVIGQISCLGALHIGEKGVVHCTIDAAEIVVAGQLYGDVRTEGKLAITATGQLKGTVKARTLAINPGAVFQGLSDMPAKESSIGPDSELPASDFGEPRIAGAEQPYAAIQEMPPSHPAPLEQDSNDRPFLHEEAIGETEASREPAV